MRNCHAKQPWILTGVKNINFWKRKSSVCLRTIGSQSCCAISKGEPRKKQPRQWVLTVGKFKGLLERGRERLRFRLQRRGVTVSVAALATLLTQTVWSAPASRNLAVTITAASMNLAMGKALTECGVSAAVATLTNGGLAVSKNKMILALFLTLLSVATVIWAAFPKIRQTRWCLPTL